MIAVIESPIGLIRLESADGFITGLYFGAGDDKVSEEPQNERDAAVIALCQQELAEYFSGRLKQFTVPLRAKGTDFRKQVWEELRRIPYGETASYQEIAKRIGNPKAVRAVGGANHHNPISIIVPCHRVIGADGSLTGFGGGLEAKRWLLELEKGNLQKT